MNIFYLDQDPQKCAEWAVDRHVVKMILEAAQLLSTAHRLLDGQETVGLSKAGRKQTTWRLSSPTDDALIYAATHVNHPCAVWARQSNKNYGWLWCYLYEHCCEYNHRYGKLHKTFENGLVNRLMYPPRNIPIVPATPLPSCMPEEYIISDDPVVNYRQYYAVGKAHLHSWKNRKAPGWLQKIPA